MLKLFDTLWFNINTTEATRIAALQIIDVVSERAVNFHDIKTYWLVQSIMDKLSDAKRTVTLRMMVEALIHHLIDLDAQAPAEQQVDNTVKPKGRNNIVNCACTLDLFAFAAPDLMEKHSATLLQYLKESYVLKYGPEFVTHMARVVDVCFQKMKRPDMEYFRKSYSILANVVYRSKNITADTFHWCIKALCSLTTKSGAEAAKVLFTLVLNVLGTVEKETVGTKIARAFTSIGIMIRYFNFEKGKQQLLNSNIW